MSSVWPRIDRRAREDRRDRGGEHVLHVVRTLGFGGMERNMRRVAIDGVRRGVRHTVLLLHDMVEVLELPPEVPLHRVATRPRDPRVPFLVAKKLLELQPSVIHVRNFGAWTDTVAARTLVAFHVPLLWSYHGMEGLTLPERERRRYKALLHFTTRVFAVSDAAREVVTRELGLPRDRIGVLANGVDVERFSPAASRPDEAGRRLVVGSVGRLFAVKNYPLLLRAVRGAIDRGLDLELRIAGDGPELDKVRRLARELELGDRLVLAGQVEDVPSFLRALDLFVLSSDNEANPNAIIEAMACGLPIVATAVGGTPDALDGGRLGRLVPRGDEVRLTEVMAELFADRALRDELGARARAQAGLRHGQARMLDQYAALYEAPRTAPLD